eukprot:208603_1
MVDFCSKFVWNESNGVAFIMADLELKILKIICNDVEVMIELLTNIGCIYFKDVKGDIFSKMQTFIQVEILNQYCTSGQFHSFCINRLELVVNLKHNRFTKCYLPSLLYKNESINLKNINKLFPNLQKITIWNVDMTDSIMKDILKLFMIKNASIRTVTIGNEYNNFLKFQQKHLERQYTDSFAKVGVKIDHLESENKGQPTMIMIFESSSAQI